jgi:hypothetical protein
MEVSGQLHGQAVLLLGIDSLPPLDRRLAENNSQSELCERKKNMLSLLGIKPRPSGP